MPAILVESLSKRYRIGAAQARYGSLRDSLMGAVRRPFRQRDAAATNTIWALKDVSFEVQPGEVVGIIGRNGAGKSTLLKILARITKPTEGRVRLRGRVGSLLEVGTGFHPELTGRENIYLNGAVLGMHRAEIERKFDEMVAFADIEQFLDTPVKHYSSGMYMRLAFAVAAHLEPEILLVDEVLAVGDAEFQKKCLGKMGEVARGGRTVLFVSHNMGAVQQLCPNSILIDHGQLRLHDKTAKVVRCYLEMFREFSGIWRRNIEQSEPDQICISEISIYDDSNTINPLIQSTKSFNIHLTVRVLKETLGSQLQVRINNQEGVPIFTTVNTDATGTPVTLHPGLHHYKISIPGAFLAPGTYSVVAASVIPNVIIFDLIDEDVRFTIEDTGGLFFQNADRRQGVIVPIFAWEEIKS